MNRIQADIAYAALLFLFRCHQLPTPGMLKGGRLTFLSIVAREMFKLSEILSWPENFPFFNSIMNEEKNGRFLNKTLFFFGLSQTISRNLLEIILLKFKITSFQNSWSLVSVVGRPGIRREHNTWAEEKYGRSILIASYNKKKWF